MQDDKNLNAVNDEKTSETKQDVNQTVFDAAVDDEMKKEQKKQADRAEREELRQQVKEKKAERAINHRKTKNLLLILTGIFCSLVILCGGIAIGVAVVPTKNYLGEEQQVLSEEYAEKPILDLAKSLNEAYVKDIVIIERALVDFTSNEEIAKYITLDQEKLNNILLFDLAKRLGDCLIVSANNVPINDFIKDETVIAIMREGCEIPEGSPVKVGDLKNFDVGKVKICTLLSVLPKEEIEKNNIIKKISQDKDATLNDLPNKINSLKLSEIYEVDCFTETDETGRSTYTVKYKAVTDSDGKVVKYVKDDAGTFYMSRNVGIWFFLMFKGEEGATFDENGNCSSYVPRNATFGQFDKLITDISLDAQYATLGQLYDIGFLEKDRPLIRSKTLDNALNLINN